MTRTVKVKRIEVSEYEHTFHVPDDATTEQIQEIAKELDPIDWDEDLGIGATFEIISDSNASGALKFLQNAGENGISVRELAAEMNISYAPAKRYLMQLYDSGLAVYVMHGGPEIRLKASDSVLREGRE